MKGWISAVSGVSVVAAVVLQQERWMGEPGTSQQLSHFLGKGTWGAWWPKSSIWVTREMWWQRANRILGCTKKGIISRDKIIIPLNLAIVRPHLEY